MAVIALLFTELLSESKSIGKVLWLTKTKPRKDDSVSEEIGDNVVPENLSVIYNCVLYGLPHLTLQEVATK